ncbi:MAG TPA: hypothetical protein VNH13_06650, partial [Candidatus Acidoferrales bacterium]|nr:hypothetical protein [Candidatus Acidoferrales bacterium]
MRVADRLRAVLRPAARPIRRVLAARAFRRDAAAALARLPSGRTAPRQPGLRPLLLGYYPSFTTNPYQSLL